MYDHSLYTKKIVTKKILLFFSPSLTISRKNINFVDKKNEKSFTKKVFLKNCTKTKK